MHPKRAAGTRNWTCPMQRRLEERGVAQGGRRLHRSESQRAWRTRLASLLHPVRFLVPLVSQPFRVRLQPCVQRALFRAALVGLGRRRLPWAGPNELGAVANVISCEWVVVAHLTGQQRASGTCSTCQQHCNGTNKK